MAYQFKLSKRFDSTRRLSFHHRPTWSEFAHKVAELYVDMSPPRLGVSYVDNDGDSITISSDQELQDYLSTRSTHDTPIKFTVHDLGAKSVIGATGGPTHQASHDTFGSRDTFGQAVPNEATFMFPDIDDGWHAIPPIGAANLPLFRGFPGTSAFSSQASSEALHAFVETVQSETGSVVSARDTFNDGSRSNRQSFFSETESSLGQPIQSKLWKGKERELPIESISNDSAVSLLASEHSPKPPVHVINIADPFQATIPRVSGHLTASVRSDHTAKQSNVAVLNVPAPTPPPKPASLLHENVVSATAAKSDLAAEHLSPSSTPESNSNAQGIKASLYNDIAALLSTAAGIFAQHPELSESVRNIVNNATNGTYIGTHGDSVKRTEQEVRNSAQASDPQHMETAEEIRRLAEEEATGRVADAVGSIMRAFTAPGSNAKQAAASAAPPVKPYPDGYDTVRSTSTPLGPSQRIGSSLSMFNPPRRRHQNPFARDTIPDGIVPPSQNNESISPSPATPPKPPTIPVAPVPSVAPTGLQSSRSPAAFVPPSAPVPPIAPAPPVAPVPPMAPAPPMAPVPPTAPAHPIAPMPPVAPVPYGMSSFSPAGAPARRQVAPVLPAAVASAPPAAPLLSSTATQMFAPEQQPMRTASTRRVTPPVLPSVQPAPQVAQDDSSELPRNARQRMELAKAEYKAMKEAYLKEREARKGQGENISADVIQRTASGETSGPATPLIRGAPLRQSPTNGAANGSTIGPQRTQLISNARGPFPQLEMVSIPTSSPPRRSNTVTGSIGRGPPPSRSRRGPVDRRVASASVDMRNSPESSSPAQRIEKQLAEVGFTRAKYINLPDMIQTYVSAEPDPTAEQEAEITSKLVDEFLSFSPPSSPAVSHSRRFIH